MIDIITPLKTAITELEADLRANPADPRVRKLQKLRETLAEFEPTPTLDKLLRPNQPQPNGNGSIPAATPNLVAETKAARMKGYIDKALHGNVKVHRTSLLEGLLAAGIMGKETKPLQALAIFLSSNKEDYESDGSGNYSLRK
jgi:hypothetical protein